MGKGDKAIFFFFISKQPSRVESHWYWSSCLSALSRHIWHRRGSQNCERRAKTQIEVAEAAKTFCVCTKCFFFFIHPQLQCQLFEFDPLSPWSQETQSEQRLIQLAAFSWTRTAKVWLQISAFISKGFTGPTFVLFVCLCCCFSFLQHLPWFPVSYRPQPLFRCSMQSGNQASIQDMLTTPAMTEQLRLNTGKIMRSSTRQKLDQIRRMTGRGS